MNEIFLSYKREDRALARKLADALNEAFKKKGWSVWWDNYISPGSSWDEVIEQRLRDARCVVVLWSRNSINAQYVKNEARKANQRRVLVPVSLESLDQFEIPTEFSHLQAANLVDWKPGSPHPEFDNLLTSITEKLAGAVPPIPSTPPRPKPPPKTPNKPESYWQLMIAAAAILLIVVVSFINIKPERVEVRPPPNINSLKPVKPREIHIVAFNASNGDEISANFSYHGTGLPEPKESGFCVTPCDIKAIEGATISYTARLDGYDDKDGHINDDDIKIDENQNNSYKVNLCKNDLNCNPSPLIGSTSFSKSVSSVNFTDH